jgi:hypothetical protein
LHLNRKVLDHIIRLASLIIDVDGVLVKGFPSIPVKKPGSRWQDHAGTAGNESRCGVCEDKLIWGIVAGLSEQPKQTEESTKLCGFLSRWV